MTTERLDKLAQVLVEEGIDAYFAWSRTSMGYLHGLFEEGHERFLTLGISSAGKCRLICPALTATQAERAGIQNISKWADAENPLALFANLAQEWDLRSGVIAVDDAMPSKMLLEMQHVLPAALFKSGSPYISRLMAVKDMTELQNLRDAGRIADNALAAGLAVLKPGVKETEVAAALNQAMVSQGGKPTFCIVAAGVLGAEPHHSTDDTVIQSGDVVILDFGCEYKGYQSDITRTVACGKASEEAHKVYDIVLRAHYAARDAIQPGVEAQEIDRAARKVIEAEGYGEFFMHRLGHGIGMQGHEAPNMVEGNTHRLAVGNCFSVEPGIYLPGKFGVRIENIVTCNAAGHESFNEEPAANLIEIS